LLIATLWTVTILSMFAIAIARYLSVELRIMKYRLARAQAEAAARSGVYVAMARLAKDNAGGTELYDWLGDPDWAFVQGDGADPAGETWRVSAAGAELDADGTLTRGTQALVTITDEERKIQVNPVTADPNDSILTALRHRDLLGPGQDAVVAQLVDYVDVDTAVAQVGGVQGQEDEVPAIFYKPKSAPLAVFDEVLVIPGFSDVPEEAVAALRPLTSVYDTAGGQLNINTVDRTVLEAIGLSGPTLDAIELFRNGSDGPTAHELDGIFKGTTSVATDIFSGGVWPAGTDSATEAPLLSAMTVASQTFAVASTGEVPLSPGRTGSPLVRAHVEAVVRRGADCGKTPDPCVVAWKAW